MSEASPPPTDPVDAEFELAAESVDRADFEESAKLSADALRAELTAAKLDPARLRAARERGLQRGAASSQAGQAAASPPAKVIPITAATGARRARPTWILLVAAAAALALLGTGTAAVVAYLSPEPTPPSPTSPVPTAPPTNDNALAAVAQQRKLAEKYFAAQLYGQCLDALDAAAKLDPAGDTAPEVAQLRAAAIAALHPEGTIDAGRGSAKPPTGPNEVPHHPVPPRP